MSGLGAWSFGTYKRGMPVPNARVVAGIRAFKQELVYVGAGHGVVVDLPIYGDQIEARVKELQEQWKLTPTGAIGPVTARYLFWSRANREALSRGIPNRLLHRMLTLESTHDPVAQGFFDEGDEGGAQIHLAFNPSITLAQAWDPGFYIPWAGRKLLEAFNYCGDWDGAVAAHNIGTVTARNWVLAGKPASGDFGAGNIDWWARGTNYVALVKRQPVF